jgi:hypothetical protein
MQARKPTESGSLVVEIGADPSVLIVVFTGAMGVWGSRRNFDFTQATDRLNYSRILCRDPYRIWYHDGLDEEHHGIRAFVERVGEHIEALGPKAMMFIGNSVGGYAALLFGHLLRADSVHAFAPQTCLQPDYVRRHRRLDTAEKVDAYDRLWASRHAEWEWFDLNEVLEEHNGRTSYFVYHCADSEPDRHAAQWISGREGVSVHSYPCDGHSVARHLAREKLLLKILRPDLKDVAAVLTDEGKLQ